MATTQREKDKAFISWCIDQYLDGKVDAEALVSTITATVKPATEKKEAFITADQATHIIGRRV